MVTSVPDPETQWREGFESEKLRLDSPNSHTLPLGFSLLYPEYCAASLYSALDLLRSWEETGKWAGLPESSQCYHVPRLSDGAEEAAAHSVEPGLA